MTPNESLWQALLDGDDAQVEVQLQVGADVNCELPATVAGTSTGEQRARISSFSENNPLPIEWAVRYGNPDLTSLLLKHDAWVEEEPSTMFQYEVELCDALAEGSPERVGKICQ